MPEIKTICLKKKICQLRQLINHGHKHISLKLHLPARFILDCPEVRGCRCDEINGLATTGFEMARRAVREGMSA